MDTKTLNPTSQIAGFASCPKGLEDLLAQELRTLGAFDVVTQKSGVDFKANPEILFSLFAHSRFAGRLYVEVAQGLISNKEADLYAWGEKIDWPSILRVHHGFKIDVVFFQNHGRGVPFKSKIFMAQKLKDAIVDQFKKVSKSRPTVDLKHPDAHFLLAIGPSETQDRYQTRLLLDLSGIPLSNRGLRPARATASLKENLACALVAWSSWNPETEVFADYMCGSGTIVLEALQLSLGISPRYTLLKNAYERNIHGQWSWERLPYFENIRKMGEDYLKQVFLSTQKRMERAKNGTGIKIIACDKDRQGLSELRESLRRLGLNESIEIIEGDFFEAQAPSAHGVVVMNLPFGERVKTEEELSDYYHHVGEKLKQDFKGYRAYLLTAKPELRKVIRLKTTARIPVWHGPFECRLLGYNLF